MITAGIDIGSRTTKLVLWDGETGHIVYASVVDSGVLPEATFRELLATACSEQSLQASDVHVIYATGYGRNMITQADKCLSEITCHAAGVHHELPGIHTVIDVGGQDSKLIAMGGDAEVVDFAMNDKCAAGTGRFLEVAAQILNLRLEELSLYSGRASETIAINNICVVFAESEIIGMIAQGISPENIIHAVHHSIAKRLVNMSSQIRWQGPVAFTGGVARNAALVTLTGEELHQNIIVPPNPTITAALGAAILAQGHHR